MNSEFDILYLIAMILIIIPLIRVLIKSSKNGAIIDFETITLLIVEAINDFARIEDAKDKSYEEFEKEVVDLIYKKIKSSELVDEKVKNALTDEAIRTLSEFYIRKAFKKLRKVSKTKA